MKNTENAQKLKRIAKEKGKKAIHTAWNSKPLHGQSPIQSQKADVDLHDTHQCLRSAGLKAETERFIVAAQDQSLFNEHRPLPVVDTPKVTILWDLPIKTDRTIQANRSDIINQT